MDIRVTTIDWDTDGQDVDLPTELELNTADERIDDVDEQLADWLSDRYGWAVNSLSWEPKPSATLG